MPNAFCLLTPSKRIGWNSELYLLPEKIHLFMPSKIEEPAQRVFSCVGGLSAFEVELRQAEAREAAHAIDAAQARLLHAMAVRKKGGSYSVQPKAMCTLERKVHLEKNRLKLQRRAIERLDALA
jgi:hypothetical protein